MCRAGGREGARGSSGERRREHSPGTPATLGQHSRTGMRVWELHPRMPTSIPEKPASCPRKVGFTVSETGRPFSQRREARPSSLVLTHQGQRTETRESSFGHSCLLAGSPRLHQGAQTQPHWSTLKDQARLLAVIPASEGTFQEPPPCYLAGLAEVDTGCCSQLPKAMDRNALVSGSGFVEIKPRPGQFGPLPRTLRSSCLVPESLMQPSLLLSI